MILDMRTLMLVHFIIDILNVGAMTIIWRQYRKRFAGIFFWLLDMVLQMVGIGLILLRGLIPDFMSIFLSNTLIIFGLYFLLIGLERFVGKRRRCVVNYVLMVLYVLLITFFISIRPALATREIIISAMIIILGAQISWLLLWGIPRELRQMARITGLTISGYVMASFIRITLLMAFPPNTSDFFRSGLVDAVSITMYLSLHICLIVALISMVTQRLLGEVRVQEEKFTKAFHSSPYAITLTRPSDGRILEVNDGFVSIAGYQRAEAIGKTTLDLRLWAREQDRVAVVEALTKDRMQGVEAQFRRKSGELMTGVISADIIFINNERYILSSIADITERKRAEEVLRQNEAQYRLLAENMVDVVWAINPAGRFTYVSPSVQKLRGYTPQEVLAQSPAEALTPASQQTMQAALAAAMPHIEQGAAHFALDPKSYELEQPCKDGSTVWTEAMIRVLFDDQGNFSGFLGVSRDITERKRAEAEREQLVSELQASLAQVRQLSGFLPICASCKKIRDDAGYWHQVEAYISQHSEAEFSHGICPDCMKKLYPELVDK
jgi:PAS domain S-box-containing protein